ncbi:putative Thioredoxin domain, 5'-adenylylsulfate reductase-like protein [Helianthus annuus]|nr:putative Thioredoxin domain, 5'-adenylylsulfate reductase-like protein [Helianthus annuus]
MTSSSVMLIFIMFISSMCTSSASFSPICYPQINPFVLDLQLQCPNEIVSCSPIEMDGESLDNLLSFSKTNAYTAILFYASWCPFSEIVQPKFDALALMYPQIKHVKVEQSSALQGNLFSRHGIHSVPSIVIANKTARVHYHGPKDLQSLLEFYKITTGLKHAMNITEHDVRHDSSSENSPRALRSLKDEPYLVFSVLFVLLKALLFLCPDIVSNVIALWVTYIPRLNLAIFGESKQLLTHALHLFDVKSVFGKLKLSKSRKFHNGARSARVLASSLASVSLGESSSSSARE